MLGISYGALASSGSAAASPWATWNGSLDGSLYVFRTNLVVGSNVTMLSSSLVVVTWEDAGGSDTMYACAGTISGVAITWGTPKELLAVDTGVGAFITRMSATTAIITWIDNLVGTIATGVGISVSGTTITAGTPIVIATDAGGIDDIQVTSLTSAKAVAVYNGSGVKGKAVTVNISTLVLTLGTPFAFNTTNTADNPAIAPISSTQVLIAYSNSANSSYGTAQVLDISGDTITGNTAYAFNAVGSAYFRLVALSASKFGVLYSNASNSNRGTVSILSVAGTVVTFGSAVQVSTVTGAGMNTYGFCKADSQTLFSIWKLDATHINASTITVSGTTATINAPVLYKATNTTEFGCGYIDDYHLITCFRDNNNSNRGTGKISRVLPLGAYYANAWAAQNAGDGMQMAIASPIISSKGTIAFWYHRDSAAGTKFLLNSGDAAGTSGFNIYAADQGGGVEYLNIDLKITGVGATRHFLPAVGIQTGWHSCIISYDFTQTEAARPTQVVIDGVLDGGTDSGATTGTMSVNTQISINRYPPLGATLSAPSSFSEIFLELTNDLDLTVTANIRKIISALGKPVSMGSDGSLVTGTQPVFYAKSAAASITTNSGSGAAFTTTGTLVTSASSPSD